MKAIGFGVEADVERVQHRAGHRHAEMRLEHRRHVGQHHRDRVADADAARGERAGEPAAARVGLAPGRRAPPWTTASALRIDLGRALEEAQRRQRRRSSPRSCPGRVRTDGFVSCRGPLQASRDHLARCVVVVCRRGKPVIDQHHRGRSQGASQTDRHEVLLQRQLQRD